MNEPGSSGPGRLSPRDFKSLAAHQPGTPQLYPTAQIQLAESLRLGATYRFRADFMRTI